MTDSTDHYPCTRFRLVGECGALAVCYHDGPVYTEDRHWRSPVLEVTPERLAELKATVGPCA